VSIVAWDTHTLDDNEVELLAYPDGGAFLLYADGSALGAQDLTINAYTRVNQDSEIRLAATATIAGPTPVAPAEAILQVISSEAVSFTALLSTATPADIPWRVHSRGRLTTVDDAEGAKLATGAEDSLVTVGFGGLFYLLVDVFAMAIADDLKLRLKTAGGGPGEVPATVGYELLEDVQALGIVMMGDVDGRPVEVVDSLEATLEQSAGTLRTYPWKLIRVA
jgi:hypothetical protein